ncbi:hypothetical protein FB451DRAFT_275485 [Mycena latifolia]|nr:hypothetical protein FB451DRAFT_275485 [Mycena latifolia]
MPRKTGKKRTVGTSNEKYEARELWERSPSPVEDWGSDAEAEYDLNIVGEEVGYGGEIKYEVILRGRLVNSAPHTPIAGRLGELGTC